jgi:hypothetical protein
LVLPIFSSLELRSEMPSFHVLSEWETKFYATDKTESINMFSMASTSVHVMYKDR